MISIIEDKLIELMRKHYYEQSKIPYQPIPASEEDYRAKRITDYLNLVNRIVKEQVEKLKQSSFEADSEIVKYFEMLPENSMLRKVYITMKSSRNEHERQALVTYLQSQVQPGRIDVNIMTKVDKNNHDKAGNIHTESSDVLFARLAE